MFPKVKEFKSSQTHAISFTSALVLCSHYFQKRLGLNKAAFLPQEPSLDTSNLERSSACFLRSDPGSKLNSGDIIFLNQKIPAEEVVPLKWWVFKHKSFISATIPENLLSQTSFVLVIVLAALQTKEYTK